MFQGLSKQHLKQLHKKWKKIYGSITVPHHSLVAKGKEELEAIFQGQLQYKYCREILQVLDYARSKKHFISGRSMLEDLISDKRIVFNNYR